MFDLEDNLRQLGKVVTYPSTPNIAASVGRRLHEQEIRPRPIKRTWRLKPSIAVAVILILIPATAAAIEPTRNAVLDWLGLRSVKIERVNELAIPENVKVRLKLGQRLSLREASKSAGFPVYVPSILDQPDRIYYLDDPVTGRRLSLVYPAGDQFKKDKFTGIGLLITEFKGSELLPLIEKVIGPGTSVEEVVINGQRGAWIEGNPHYFAFRNAQGEIVPEELRLASNALVWETHGIILRLEGAVDRSKALAIARSMKPNSQ